MANLIRAIGDEKYIKDNCIWGQLVTSTEAVIYYSNETKGSQVVEAAMSASIPGMLNREYKDDGTIYNAIKHASWNAIATIYTNDTNYVKNFTNAHEYGQPIVTSNTEIFKHTKMDIFNNGVGRYQGYLASQRTFDQDMAIRLANGAVIERAYNSGLIIVIK